MKSAEEYKIMLDALLGSIMHHIDNELKFTFKKNSGCKDFELLEEVSKLSDHEFAALGCRIRSYNRILVHFEDYLKEICIDTHIYHNYMSIKALSKYYNECAEYSKKE